ncbi:alpha-L-fucosidase [Maribacter algarum]|uniref:alpha-L-fucosidase n=1 Tax=Maribacter algarum (ex Zhang et al. 2020) TaxID=2578118 RepID=A0A5S3PS76_9FLAO|nr:alpha-L-fucosidase [Maribacter algarum]TMM56753.1 alpha-L-fucosidase [Maribacter algarum]
MLLKLSALPTFTSVFLSILFFFFTSCNEKNIPSKVVEDEQIKYEANWESLSKHIEAPNWFQDAKFGIYFHWGVYSVPAYGSEWYASKMYHPGTSEFEHHKNTYGPQSEFGYKDFVPDFTAEHFDAEEWAALFKKSGAKFAGPVAQHHDGFAMWDSEVNPWNAADKGPKRDITGELTKALRKNDLKLITTFHHARNLQRNKDNQDNWRGFNSHFPYNPDYDTSSEDPVIRKLYGNIPTDEFHQYWSDQITEVLDQYQPDIIWFDSWFNFIPEKRVQQMCADYFNKAAKTNQEVVIAYKQSDLPLEVGVHDIEQGGRKDISERTWMTDITLSFKSWCFVEGQTYKPTSMVMRNLIDVVSKNGVVLLNISPKADGTISEEQRKILREMGSWFSKYGESIYATKPWDLFGFGNASAGEGSHGGQSSTVEYTANDIRITQSRDEKSLYMIFLGKPKVGDTIKLHLMAKHRYAPHSPIKRISLLGTDIEPEFNLGDTHFELTIPDAPMDDIATVFKFELE